MKTPAARVTNPKPATYGALLDAGTELLLEKGYNHCGIDDILRLAKARKGSFYHFFASKEDFGLRVIERYAERRFERLDGFLLDKDRTPLERLRRSFEDSCRRQAEQQFRAGCLFGSLSQELSNQSEAIRKSLDACHMKMRSRLKDCLIEAQQAGELRTDLDAGGLAEYCHNAWEGAIVRMKTVRSIEPLELFIRLTFDLILRPD